MLGIKATLIDGAYHDVDSSVLAFEIAGRAATREGLRKCKSRLKEPIMKVRADAVELLSCTTYVTRWYCR